MKRVFSILLACFILISVTACTAKNENAGNAGDAGSAEVTENQNETVDNNTSEAEEPKSASGGNMVEYIKSIAPEDREEFLSFWHEAIIYSKLVKRGLRESNNTDSFEFDPSDEKQIPEELKEICDFSHLNSKNEKGLHKDFNIKIDGLKVEFSFGGLDIYPTEYAYSDIQGIIDSLK